MIDLVKMLSLTKLSAIILLAIAIVGTSGMIGIVETVGAGCCQPRILRGPDRERARSRVDLTKREPG